MSASDASGSSSRENDIDRLPVDGVEVDPLVEARQQAERLGQSGEPRVRDRDAAAHPRRAKAFALHQRRSYRLNGDTQGGAGGF